MNSFDVVPERILYLGDIIKALNLTTNNLPHNTCDFSDDEIEILIDGVLIHINFLCRSYFIVRDSNM